MPTCINATCGKSFQAKRSDAKFCSGNCRAQWSNSRKKEPNTQGGTPAPITPMPPAYPPAPIYNHAPQPMQFAGLGNPTSGYFEIEYRRLDNENRDLREKVIRYETEERMRQQMGNAEPAKSSPLNGIIEGLGEGMRTNPAETINALGGFVTTIKSLMPGGSPPGVIGGSDILAGLPEERRDMMQAVVEIMKPLPDDVVGFFLGLIGKASENPTEFMEGLKQSMNDQ